MSQTPKAPARLTADLLVRKDQVGREVAPPAPPAPTAREVITVRILAQHNEQLRDLAHDRRVTKQSLIDEALRQYLEKIDPR
jgi:hypothetical protein